MNFEEANDVIHTCAICGLIFKRHEVSDCLKEYPKFYVDPETFYFYPALDDGTIVTDNNELIDSLEEASENVENLDPNTPGPSSTYVGKTNKKTKVSKMPNNNKKLTFAEMELLILEVEKRRPLWDFTIPFQKRGPKLTRGLWEEVARELNYKLDGEEVQTKFKNVRDRYRRLIQKEKQASGSARTETHEGWKFYNILKFLRDSCLLNERKSNLTQERRSSGWKRTNPDEFIDEETLDVDDQDHFVTPGRINKKQRRDSSKTTENSDGNALQKIAEAMCREESNKVVLPTPPQMDEVDGILLAVGLQLRRLQYTRRMQLLLEIMRMVNSTVEEENENT